MAVYAQHKLCGAMTVHEQYEGRGCAMTVHEHYEGRGCAMRVHEQYEESEDGGGAMIVCK